MAQKISLPRGLSPDRIEEQLNRILDSDVFKRSERLSRFLRYTVEEGLADRADNIKEYTIGREVFDKAEDFDTRSDPIVRVEAGRLRSKIREYYATDGAEDGVFVGVRDRGYLPLFRLRETAQQNDSSKNLKPCIAVLPFRDLSQQQNQEPFCEALTHGILNGLIQEEGLNVIGRTLSRRLDADIQNFTATTKELGVEQFVEGSVQRQDNQVRISVELANAENGRSVWAKSFDRDLDNVFVLQQQVAREIVQGLSRVLLCGDEAEVCEPENAGVALSDGYADYVRGMKAWSSGAVTNLKESIESFEEAARRDREYGEAWAGLANARVALALSRTSDPGSLMRQAKTAAYRAIAVENGIAEAHAAKGIVEALCAFDWAEAEASFDCARALDPSLPILDQWHALGILLPKGKIEEATQKIDHAQRAEPTSVLLHYYRGVLHYLSGKFEDACTILEVVVELEPEYEAAHLLLGDAYHFRDMDEQALACYSRVLELSQESTACGKAAMAYFHATRGRKREARKLLKELMHKAGKDYSWPYDAATVYAALDEPEHAFDWLERAREDGVPSLAWIHYDPKFASLKGDQRFRELLERMGLQNVDDLVVAS